MLYVKHTYFMATELNWHNGELLREIQRLTAFYRVRDDARAEKFEAHADEIERKLGQIVTGLEVIAGFVADIALSNPATRAQQDGSSKL